MDGFESFARQYVEQHDRISDDNPLLTSQQEDAEQLDRAMAAAADDVEGEPSSGTDDSQESSAGAMAASIEYPETDPGAEQEVPDQEVAEASVEDSNDTSVTDAVADASEEMPAETELPEAAEDPGEPVDSTDSFTDQSDAGQSQGSEDVGMHSEFPTHSEEPPPPPQTESFPQAAEDESLADEDQSIADAAFDPGDAPESPQQSLSDSGPDQEQPSRPLSESGPQQDIPDKIAVDDTVATATARQPQEDVGPGIEDVPDISVDFDPGPASEYPQVQSRSNNPAASISSAFYDDSSLEISVDGGFHDGSIEVWPQEIADQAKSVQRFNPTIGRVPDAAEIPGFREFKNEEASSSVADGIVGALPLLSLLSDRRRDQ